MCEHCPQIPVKVELGEAGLYYGTSRAERGLLVIGKTIKEVMDKVPNAIHELRMAKDDDETVR